MSERPSTRHTRVTRNRRRVQTAVERLGPARRPAWVDTGAFELPERSGVDSSGVFYVPPADATTSTLVPHGRVRPRTATERRSRLIYATLVLLLALAFCWEAIVIGAARVAGGSAADRWRTVPVRVSSDPPGATVFIDNVHRGDAPFAFEPRCRGRRIEVRLELRGYAPWLWSGLCPLAGPLRLAAQLQARADAP